MIKDIRIATRQSRLALWQAEYVADTLRRTHPGVEIEIVPMSTRGDMILDKALAKVGGVLEATEEGLAEIGLVSSLFEQAKLQIQNVTYVTPFVSDDTLKIASMIDGLHETSADMRAPWEANGLEYLGCAIGIDDYLLMTNFPINSLADLDGRKIGAVHVPVE